MLLTEILYKVNLVCVAGITQINVDNLCFDSREAKKGSLFIAIKGVQLDGHQYINNAIDKGAVAVLCEDLPDGLNDKVTYIQVNDSAKAMALMAANFYQHPATKLQLVGVTGTNGKTTTVSLLFQLFKALKFNVGLISTIFYQINEVRIKATHTTPNALKLNELLAKMVDEGCEYCFMEVSSHAVVQQRITGLKFKGAVFTNLTHDHIDYHGSFAEYRNAKKGFFDQLNKEAFALVNADDKNGQFMCQNTKAKCFTYALKKMADFKGKILENTFEGLLMQVQGKEMHARLIGDFNAYNLLTVYATASLLLNDDELMSDEGLLTEISKLKAAEGRFEYVENNRGIIGVVDYAHTPDALEKVLTTVNVLRTKNEQLITVVGCGGDRDTQKRPIMAQVACDNSDRVILTSDNPRSEAPEAIIEDMKKGVKAYHQHKVMAITNRKEAINRACSMANKGDIIVLAGKGHEKYQEIEGVRLPFDDKQVLSEALKHSW
jgi:UDP-N-acetylmuramoyl-L-alanyl-D-glutamate--2,6-diaminopimelate ligase